MSFLSSSKSESVFLRPSALARTPSRRSQRPVPSPLKAIALFLGFLPLPPIIAIIYAAIGHAVLHAAHHLGLDSPHILWAILSLPLALLLYLLLFPTKTPAPEDFFEDEEDMREPWLTYATYAFLAILTLTLGAISGALGAVCLSLPLSPAEAAETGIVGGVITDAGLGLLAFTVFAMWWDFFRPKPQDDL
ncbi:hypothetical protein C8F01DRAFT_1099703 [Mycena amicta]|nr:hypothetical protein C8F01DRAFT_1099703 [Mycena amicta]